jgi:hypothetical protein
MHDADTEVRDGEEARNRINFFGQCASWRAGARRAGGRGQQRRARLDDWINIYG